MPPAATDRAIEHAVQVYAIANLGIVGVSHLLQPHAWIDFFAYLRERGKPGVFAVAFMSLMFGSIIVGFHDVWSGIPLVLTLIGWAQVLKALLYFVFPAFGLRQLQRPSHERPQQFVIGGALLLALASVLGYHVWTT
jgi:hypothetical protein